MEATKTCEHCTDPSPTSEADLSYHLNTKHKDKIPPEWLLCPICSWSYSSKEDFGIHKSFCKRRNASTEDTIPTIIGIQCQFCPTVFGKTGFNIYYEHARRYHQKQVERDWKKCEICLLAYPTEKTVKNHQR